MGGHKLLFKFFPSFSADLNQLKEFMNRRSGAITPQGILSLEIRAENESAFMNETITVLKELSLL